MILLIITISVAGLFIAFIIYKDLFRKEKKKVCPHCGGELKDTGNVADISYFCKKCGLMTYNFYKYEGEFKERSVNY